MPHRHLLVSVLFIAPLALGSFHPWAVAVLCAASGLAALLLVLEGSRHGVRPGLLGIGLAVLLLYTCLQLVPVPPEISTALWSSGHAVWENALAFADDAGRWHPLSLEPAAGAVEAAKIALLLAVVLGCRQWVWSAGPRPLLTALALVGVTCALVALTHRLFGIDQAYGLYHPQEVRTDSWLSAPLLNRNHLAGLMALCAPIAVGLAVEEEFSRRLLWILAAVTMGAAGLSTLSRGGMAALLLGGGLLIVLIVRCQRDEEDRTYWPWAVGGVIALLAGGLYVASEALVTELVHSEVTTKAEVWAAAIPLVRDYLPLGVGRGAFGAVFPAYNTVEPQLTFTHAENLLIQLGAETGVVGMLACAALVGGVGYLVIRGASRPATAGAIAGIAALLAHNIVDFSLELPGVSIPFVAALVATMEDHTSRLIKLRLPPRATMAVVAALALLASAAAVWSNERQLPVEEARLWSIARAEEPRFDAALAQRAVSHHPADYMIPYAAGVWAYRSKQANPLTYLNQALIRNPRWAPAHLWSARTLAATGHAKQAMIEYRTAVELDRRLTPLVGGETMRLWPTFADVRYLVDCENPPLDLWDLLSAEWQRRGAVQEAEASDDVLLERTPAHHPALIRSARRALTREDIGRARSFISKLPPEEPVTVVLSAQIEAAIGSEARALKMLEEAIDHRPDDQQLLPALALLQEKTGDHVGARRSFVEWERVTPRKNLPNVFMARGAFEERAGRYEEALHYFERAAYFGAGHVALRGVARVAERSGDTYRAWKAYRDLAAASGDESSRDAAKARELEQRMDRTKLQESLEGR